MIYSQVQLRRGNDFKIVLLPGYGFMQGDVITMIDGSKFVVERVFGTHEVIEKIVEKNHNTWFEDRR